MYELASIAHGCQHGFARAEASQRCNYPSADGQLTGLKELLKMSKASRFTPWNGTDD